MLTVPLVGAAALVAILLGADIGHLLQGTLNEIFTTLARALMAEPVAFAGFVASFAIVLLGGAMLMFTLKGGTVDVFIASNAIAGPIEREPVRWDTIRAVSRFGVDRFVQGCTRLCRRYLALGLLLMLAYAISGGFVSGVPGLRLSGRGERLPFIGWASLAALSGIALVIWITAINLVYLLLQIAVAIEDIGVTDAFRVVARLVRSNGRDLGGVFLVIFVMIVGATFASALALSGVGLIAFVPLVGLVVFPLQLAAWLLRGLVFEYIGLTAIGAYVAVYRHHAERAGARLPITGTGGATPGVPASFS